MKKDVFVTLQLQLDPVLTLRSQRVYEKFVFDYATYEDKIRGLWVQVLEEREKLRVCPIRPAVPCAFNPCLVSPCR